MESKIKLKLLIRGAGIIDRVDGCDRAREENKAKFRWFIKKN